MKRIASILAQAGAPLRGVRCTLALSLLLSLLAGAAGADVRDLVTVNPKVSWTGSPQVIYLHADGTAADESDYDHLALKYTDTSAAGTLTIAEGVKGAARVLLVGGGGAGGSGAGTGNNRGAGGGGGAGGFLEVSDVPLDADTTYSITVGKGGEPQPAESKLPGGNGTSSLFQQGATTLYEAFGGGGGGAECDGIGTNSYAKIGSGGGGSREYTTTSTNHEGGKGSEQGKNGGAGTRGQTAGGGGGAGGAGLDGGDNGVATPAVNIGGRGGNGKSSDIICTNGVSSVLPLYYAGGGGGGTRSQTAEEKLGPGGLGGGGRGAGGNDLEALPGEANTGGGGGGGTCTLVVSSVNKSKAGAAGGSGVVIVRITQLVETQVSLPVIDPKTFNRENQTAFDFGTAYTYVSGDTNATNVGSYSFVVKPGPDFEWDSASGGGTGGRTVNWSIVKRKIEKPTIVTGLVYDETDKIGVKYTDELPDYCTFDASSATNATNAGTYSYSVSLKEPANTSWADETTAPVSGSWTISPVKVAQPQPKTGLVYDGSEQAGFASLDYARYELTDGAASATDGGTTNFTFALLGNASAVNYVWDTDPVSSEPYSGEWSIAAATNEITSLSITGWRVGETPNAPSLTAKFGAATAMYSYGLGDDVESVTEWLDDAAAIDKVGTWVLRAIIPETSSWFAVTSTTTFVMWDDPAILFHNHVEIAVRGTTNELANFIVPVRISESGMRGFYYDEANPTNIVFIDKSNNLLPYDVDTWDESGESLIWVKLVEVPKDGIMPATMYWNLREGHIAPANEPTDVWSDYVGVWHMSEPNAGTATVRDASGHKDGTGHKSSYVAAGIFGKARGRHETPNTSGYAHGPAVTVPEYADLDEFSNGAFTISGWVLLRSTTTGWAYLFARKNGDTTTGWAAQFRGSTGSSGKDDGISFWRAGGSGQYYTFNTANKFSANTWAKYDFVRVGNTLAFYLNGSLVEKKTDTGIATIVGGTQPFTIGGMNVESTNPSGTASTLNGYSDEVRLMPAAVDGAYIAADYKYQSDSTMITNGIVYLDGLKVDYWEIEPSLKYPDMLSWDIDPSKNVDAEGHVITNEIETVGKLRYGQVTNYIYSVYDKSEVYSSISAITKGGTYRAVFARVQTEDFLPLEKVIEFRITQSKPYYDIGGNGGDSGRVLLMNNHTKDPNALDIDYQGWYDADNTEQIGGRKVFAGKSDTVTFWHHENITAPEATSYNLKHGTESVLYTKNYGSRLWHLKNCCHGNTFPSSDATALDSSQNYLPWNGTYSRRINAHNTLSPSRSTVGQLVMQNTTDAVVYSSCFTNGIGTIYFDAVNGWCRSTEDYDNYKLVVEIATNTVESLEPIDINGALVETNSVNEVEVEEGAFFSYYEVVTDDDGNIVTTNYYAVVTNDYGKLEGCWQAVDMIPFVRDTAGGAGTFDRLDETKELALAVANGGTVGNFYRVAVPVDIAGPVRFRIRRTTADKNWQADRSSFILLDNIIASPPAMGGSLLSPGHYDGTKSGKRQLGWELSTSVPYPSITDGEVFGGAVPTYYVNYGDGTEPNTNEFFHSAKMHYRWSYLGQVTNDWSTIVLNPADGFKATSAFEIPGHECDVEYWYEYILQAPYYSYVDYSGAGKLIDYTEERGVQTNVCANGTIMASGGTNWFFRVRDGRSDYSGVDIVYRREGSEAELRAPMMIVGDNVWRGFIQTTTNLEGKISWRIEAHDRQTEPYAAYAASTSHYYCTTADLKLPVSDKIEVGSETSWSALDIDALTGYVMFQIDDERLGLTVVHADYQNFNAWSDAFGTVFVGNSTADDSKSGTSPKKQTFAQDFDAWKPMSATNPKWMFTDFDNIRSMLGRTAYDPFESDDDGLWECGPGMWVSKAYRNDAAGTGVAL